MDPICQPDQDASPDSDAEALMGPQGGAGLAGHAMQAASSVVVRPRSRHLGSGHSR